MHDLVTFHSMLRAFPHLPVWKCTGPAVRPVCVCMCVCLTSACVYSSCPSPCRPKLLFSWHKSRPDSGVWVTAK